MSVEENRNCGCNNNDSNMVANSANYAMNNPYNNSNNNNSNNNFNYNNDEMNSCDCDLRKKMLHQIMSLSFAINELALYLDTHVDDERALCLHRKYCKELKELEDKYQKVFGPLTINYPCNKWRWIEEPWPWERGNY